MENQPIVRLINDSEVLKIFSHDEPSNSFLDDYIDVILPLYQGNYQMDDKRLIDTIDTLVYLDNHKKLDEMLIILCFRPNVDELILRIKNQDVQMKVFSIKLKDTEKRSFIINDMIDPLKYLN